MIFDAPALTDMICSWKVSREDEELNTIIKGCVKLAEVIASQFSDDSNYREDLIQECLARVPFAINHYDPTVANLHKYMTSVFRNRCISYIQRESRQDTLLKELDVPAVYSPTKAAGDILSNLIERNRCRFSNIPVDDIDNLSRIIYLHLSSGSRPGNGRGIVKAIQSKHPLSRSTALTVYYSSLVYLRKRYKSYARLDFEDPEELSLLPDLREAIGDEAYTRIMLLFGGMNLRIPS